MLSLLVDIVLFLASFLSYLISSTDYFNAFNATPCQLFARFERVNLLEVYLLQNAVFHGGITCCATDYVVSILHRSDVAFNVLVVLLSIFQQFIGH